MPKIYNEFEVNDKEAKIFFADGTYTLIDTEDILTVLKNKWYKTENNYVRCSKGFMHRILTQCPNNRVVDHINHNTLDNRKSNLRICTASENGFNHLSCNMNSTTGIRGITLNPKTNEYNAVFTFNGERYDLGSFKEKEDAEFAISLARFHISEFSEIDNINVSEEFLKQKELRDEFYKKWQGKKSLPKLSMYCCGRTYAISEPKTHNAFRCYLHKPIKNNYSSFCITYRFQCPMCGCIKTVTYFYDKFGKIHKTKTEKKTLHAIKMLRAIQDVLVKEMDLTDMRKFVKFINSPHSNWFYGVPVNEKLFKRVSLTGEEAGVVPVQNYYKPDYCTEETA